MPIYEYVCRQCRADFEALVPAASRRDAADAPCPQLRRDQDRPQNLPDRPRRRQVRRHQRPQLRLRRPRRMLRRLLRDGLTRHIRATATLVWGYKLARKESFRVGSDVDKAVFRKPLGTRIGGVVGGIWVAGDATGDGRLLVLSISASRPNKPDRLVRFRLYRDVLLGVCCTSPVWLWPGGSFPGSQPAYLPLRLWLSFLASSSRRVLGRHG